MILHKCGGRVLFETENEALSRLSREGKGRPEDERKEFRLLYCNSCGQSWNRKREMWEECTSVEDE